jgi:hypothetical protein
LGLMASMLTLYHRDNIPIYKQKIKLCTWCTFLKFWDIFCLLMVCFYLTYVGYSSLHKTLVNDPARIWEQMCWTHRDDYNNYIS